MSSCHSLKGFPTLATIRELWRGGLNRDLDESANECAGQNDLASAEAIGQLAGEGRAQANHEIKKRKNEGDCCATRMEFPRQLLVAASRLNLSKAYRHAPTGDLRLAGQRINRPGSVNDDFIRESFADNGTTRPETLKLLTYRPQVSHDCLRIRACHIKTRHRPAGRLAAA
jgi:hypothetical protein